MNLNILVLSNKTYKDWNNFKLNMDNIVAKVQYEMPLATHLKILGNGKMAVAWAFKNNILCEPFSGDWDSVGLLIAFNSGAERMLQHISTAKGFGLVVHEIDITP